jgi:phenylacetate-CoA oxygenase PaaH subunit
MPKPVDRADPTATEHRLEPWEVFRRERPGDPMVHGGSVMAPDAELARHYAREMFGRRQESERQWIVRRSDMGELHDMAQRWAVVRLLDEGLHYADISKRTGASTATITRIASCSARRGWLCPSSQTDADEL